MQYTNTQVIHCKQIKDQQCWAACMKMMLDQKRIKENKPQIENKVVLIDYESIISRTMHNDANRSIPDSFLQSAFYTFGIDINVSKGKANWETIKSNIQKNLPLMMGVSWHMGGGHVMVISGYEEENTQKWVWLNDPALDEGKRVHFDRLLNGNYEFAGRNQSDEWDLTVTIKGDIDPQV